MANLDLDRLEADLAKATPGWTSNGNEVYGDVDGEWRVAVFDCPRATSDKRRKRFWAETFRSNAALAVQLQGAAPELLRRARALERLVTALDRARTEHEATIREDNELDQALEAAREELR